MRLFYQLMICGLIFSGCSHTPEAAPVKSYFDMSSFFTKQASALQQKNPLIQKQVSQNGASEKKSLHIQDWLTELAVFSSSDINKPSWSKSYTTVKKGTYTDYIAKEPQLRTRLIRIESDLEGNPTHIFIHNQTNNFLFSSEEKLHYYPDSLYSIQKNQSVLILGSNSYRVTGFLNKPLNLQ